MTLTASKETLDKCREIAGRFRHEQALNKGREIRDEWRKARGYVGHIDWLKNNERLLMALKNASECEQFIIPEQERLKLLWDEAGNETERAAREWQIDYVGEYLTRAASLAKERQRHFRTLTIFEEKERIRDIIHWFRYYAWGYDPRARTPLSVVPFELFPTQEKLVKWLDDSVFFRRTSGLIEKSRDEGATETIVRWGLYSWLFRDGFSMLLSTRKDDEVDSKTNQNTLFERIRYQIRLLPSWQLPAGFDPEKNMNSVMKLSNPANQNTLLGEAPVENMGRGGRVTCAMLDEFAFWPFAGYPQYRSLSQTTDSLIVPSSVAGRLNQYADLAFDGVTPKFTMDWRDNPFKDKRWYDSLPYGYISPKMSRTTIAQEVDRNYDAAQPGKVWDCPEPYVFITLDEFLEPFIEAGLGHKFFDERDRFRIPPDWRSTRLHDYGQTPGHEWAYLLGSQPHARYPLHDSHFVFFGVNLEPTGLTTDDAVDQWRDYEKEIGLRDDDYRWITESGQPWSYHSHEQKDLRRVLLQTYGESWMAWDTDYETGIATIEDWWNPIDREKPNPFRPVLNGRCQLMFVAPNNEYQLAFNDRINQHFVTSSRTERGFMTLRKQISAYHYPETELGKAVKAMRPVKEFDDIIDCLRGYSVNWNRTPRALTETESISKYLVENTPEHVRGSELTDDQKVQRNLWVQQTYRQLQDEKKNSQGEGRHTGRSIDSWRKARRG